LPRKGFSVTDPRELRPVELVADDGTSIGSSTVATAHTRPGQLHRAFSVVLFDHSGRMLLQQRAAAKIRFPLAWANSCCGHPEPGETAVAAASTRLVEELGLADVALTEVGVYVYSAEDPASGLIEREYDHVLIGYVDPQVPLAPDPGEVATTVWTADLQTLAGPYAPWLPGVLKVAQSPS
jgi:isopentenyl-diphosphate delta-isomerase